jgi:lysophospholipase L1-like esterase
VARSPRRTPRLLAPVVTALAVLALLPAGPPAQAAPASSAAASAVPRTHTGVWSSSLQGVHGTSPDVTVRQIAQLSVPVTSVRVRFGNPFGAQPVRLREVWVGKPLAQGLARLVPGSNRRLTFAGAGTVSIPPGGQAWSDEVALTVGAQQDVAVSVYAPGSPVNDHTFPPYASDPPASYISTGGNTARDESDRTFPIFPVVTGETPGSQAGYHPGQTWWVDLISGDAAARGTVVALGDSITDGYQAVGPPGRRWTDVLAERLNAVPAASRLAVTNAGISGNTVSRQPNPYDPTGQCCGPPAPERLRRDVLSVPGVRTVLLLEGTNDIGGGEFAPPASAARVITGMREIVRRAHDRGLPVVGLTVLPMCNAAGGSREAARQEVNQWIRTSGELDAVVDTDALLRDPAVPTVIRKPLRHDCYHPNAAGDALIGGFIPLWVLGVPVADRPALRVGERVLVAP